MGSQSALEHSQSLLVRETTQILSHSSQVDQATCGYRARSLFKDGTIRTMSLIVYASRCPGHSVMGFPILHRACTYLQGMERGFVYISHRMSEIKKAEGQQH